MNLQQIVADIAGHINNRAEQIEGDADANNPDGVPDDFGISITTVDGETFSAGSEDRFPMQSISKVFALDLALEAVGQGVFDRFGREPSGDPYDSMIDLERTRGVPRNPFINAGALVAVDMLVESHGAAAYDTVIDLIRKEAGSHVPLNDEVLNQPGDLNRAMIEFMRYHDNIRCPTEDIKQAYARQCAIALNVKELACAGRYLVPTRLMSDDPVANRRARQTRTVLALMTTCGHYDASGDFATRVGLPAKSGVGGGILAIVPQSAAVAVWSPNLDQHGNSILGVRGLEMLVERTGWSLFGPPLGS